MFLEKHGTAKFPMEEVTGLDQRFCPLCSALLTTAISLSIRFYPTAHVTPEGLLAYQEETLRRKERLEQQK